MFFKKAIFNFSIAALPTLSTFIVVSCGSKNKKNLINVNELSKLKEAWSTTDSFPKQKQPLTQKSTTNIKKEFEDISGFQENYLVNSSNPLTKPFEIKAVYTIGVNPKEKKVIYKVIIGNNLITGFKHVSVVFEKT